MKAIGLDVHSRHTAVAVIDAASGELRRHRLTTDQLVPWLAGLDEVGRVVMESGGLSMVLARQLLALSFDVIVVDAFKAHRFTQALNTAKTDRLDAQALARLALDGASELAVWVPDELIDDLRALTRTRHDLVRAGTCLRNEIRAFVRREARICPFTNVMGKRAAAWLDEFAAGLSPAKQAAFDALRQALGDNVARIRQLTATLQQFTRDCEPVQRLMTICGCGLLLAAIIVAEIGDSLRFADSSHLRSYAGIVPAVHQSGEHQRIGPLPQRGNRHLRHALVLLAQHVAASRQASATALKRAYFRHLHRHGPNPAKVALARKLCDVIFAMLRDGTDFDITKLAA